MNPYTSAALRIYRARNKVLAGLGFASYAEYLDSPLWQAIRTAKLDAEDRRCFACGREAKQVHHGSYEKFILEGPSAESDLGAIDLESWRKWLETAKLYAVCEPCHEWAEYWEFAGEKLKLPPAMATRRLKNRRRKNKLDEAIPRAARQLPKERKAREMEAELTRLIERDE